MVSESRLALALRMSPTEPARSLSASLRAVDLLLLCYLGVVSTVAAVRLHPQPSFWWLMFGHGLFLLLLVVITRPGLGLTGLAVRELYPIFLLPGLYSELDILNTGAIPVNDRLVQQWELFLFGSQISREWWQSMPSSFWSALLHAAYLSYYVIVSAPAVYLALRGELATARRFVLVVMVTFLLCYLVFMFFPVAGPYYAFPLPPAWFTDNPPARLVYAALASGSSYGAAFPSSHVAAAVAATITAVRISPRMGLVLVPATVLLTIGVVYCQMHYGVDALAGLVMGGVVAAVAGEKSVSGKRKASAVSGSLE
jgi:membrane-associated phospholipid phosphatase